MTALLAGQDAAQDAVVPALPEGADLGETRGFERLDMGGELVGLRAVVTGVDVPALAFRHMSGQCRVGVCTAPRCDRVYVDTSRNGTRRYSSTSCQNRVKTAAFRARMS